LVAVGNDIVDLGNPDALGKSQDDRFLRRVFLPEEQSQISLDSDSDCILWVLWAAKETAYKIISKINPAIPSGPLKYRVHLEETVSLSPRTPGFRNGHFSCLVETPVGSVKICALTGADYVHAYGSWGDQATAGAMHLKVFRLDQPCFHRQPESDVVRKVLCGYLGRFWHIPSGQIVIQRDQNARGAGPPVVYIQGERAPMDTSLSHHGRYGAFALFTGTDLPVNSAASK
jgi:hypothetical protein